MTEVLLAVLIGFIGSELYACLHALAKWIVRRHASKLPPGLRDRMEEEWLADVESNPSHVRKLIFALGLSAGITDLVQAHNEKKIHANLNVTFEGVSLSSTGTVTPGELRLTGHVPIIDISASDNLNVSVHENVTVVDSYGVPFSGNATR